MPHAQLPDDRHVLMIAIGLPNTDEIDLRVPLGLEAELSEIFAGEAVPFSRGAEFAADAGDWSLLLVVIGSSIAADRFSRALTRFLERHKDKSVKTSLGGVETEFKGYSEKEVRRLIAMVLEAQTRAREAWERVSRQDKPDSTG